MWPIAGPAGSITWRGGDRLAFDLGAEVGVGRLSMAHFGFDAIWEVVARVAGRVETGPGDEALVLGGWAAKSLGWDEHPTENSTVTHGTHGLALRIGADSGVAVRDGRWSHPTLAVGFLANMSGRRYLD